MRGQSDLSASMASGRWLLWLNRETRDTLERETRKREQSYPVKDAAAIALVCIRQTRHKAAFLIGISYSDKMLAWGRVAHGRAVDG
jgi:hypothetical protein